MDKYPYKVIKIGVISPKVFKNRILAVVKGELELPKGDPKMWFESPQALLRWMKEEATIEDIIKLSED